jgi:hypothetical protein
LSSATKSPTVDFPIDFSSYDPLAWPELNGDRLFHGLFQYIFFRSGQRYNVRELLIEYTGIQGTSDPANLLNHNSPELFEGGNGCGHSIVITFHRLKVRPTGFVICFIPPALASRPPGAYIFEGWDAMKQKWVLLDERQRIGERPMKPFCRVNSIDTEKEFSKFRFVHTDTQFPPMSHFALKALEIHGSIRVIHECPVPEIQFGICEDQEFDPWKIDDME